MSRTRAGRAVGGGALDLYRLAVRARGKLFSLSVAGAFDGFGPHSVLQPPIRIDGERRIRVGRDVFVGAGCWLHVLDGPAHGAPDVPADGVAISLGDGVSLAGNCVLSATRSIEIGRLASFGRGVYIADHAHGYDDPTRAVQLQGIADVAPVSIGEGAWLGENVVVLPGVSIGRGAVISANAVVSKDIADHSLAVGAPAKVVRRFGPA